MPPRSPAPDDPKPETSAHDEDRRKLLKRGLIAAPLLVTLAARPVRAQAMGSLGVYDYGTADENCDSEDDLLDSGECGRGRGRGGSLSRGRR